MNEIIDQSEYQYDYEEKYPTKTTLIINYNCAEHARLSRTQLNLPLGCITHRAYLAELSTHHIYPLTCLNMKKRNALEVFRRTASRTLWNVGPYRLNACKPN